MDVGFDLLGIEDLWVDPYLVYKHLEVAAWARVLQGRVCVHVCMCVCVQERGKASTGQAKMQGRQQRHSSFWAYKL
jgi:hypothetical protein